MAEKPVELAVSVEYAVCRSALFLLSSIHSLMYTLNSVFFRLGRSLDAQLVCLFISTPLAAGCSDGFFILGEKIRLRNSLLLLFDRLYHTHKTRSLFRPTLFGFFEAKVRGDLEEMLCVYFCGSRAVYEIMRRSEDSIVRNFHSFPITAIIGAFECGWRANTFFFRVFGFEVFMVHAATDQRLETIYRSLLILFFI